MFQLKGTIPSLKHTPSQVSLPFILVHGLEEELSLQDSLEGDEMVITSLPLGV